MSNQQIMRPEPIDFTEIEAAMKQGMRLRSQIFHDAVVHAGRSVRHAVKPAAPTPVPQPR